MASLQNYCPDIALTTDVIVGFPGETDEDFKDTYNFINGLDISYLHVFSYSERRGTEAAEMSDSVSMNIRRERNTQLTNLSMKKKRAFNSGFLGEERKVLVEKSSKQGKYTGFTDNYIKVTFDCEQNIENEMVMVKLKTIDDDYNVISSLV